MEKQIITQNSKETQELGKSLARELETGKIICLSGELGSGKTTFTQGLLEGLGAKGPYTSPTFLIMKKYGDRIYHLDAYRVEAEDVLNLGWEEIVENSSSMVIVEWAERIKDIVPRGALWIEFLWLDENRRKVTFGEKI